MSDRSRYSLDYEAVGLGFCVAECVCRVGCRFRVCAEKERMEAEAKNARMRVTTRWRSSEMSRWWRGQVWDKRHGA